MTYIHHKSPKPLKVNTCGMLSKNTKTKKKKKKPDVISKTVQLVLILHRRGRAYNEDKLTMKVGTGT